MHVLTEICAQGAPCSLGGTPYAFPMECIGLFAAHNPRLVTTRRFCYAHPAHKSPLVTTWRCISVLMGQ